MTKLKSPPLYQLINLITLNLLLFYKHIGYPYIVVPAVTPAGYALIILENILRQLINLRIPAFAVNHYLSLIYAFLLKNTELHLYIHLVFGSMSQEYTLLALFTIVKAAFCHFSLTRYPELLL